MCVCRAFLQGKLLAALEAEVYAGWEICVLILGGMGGMAAVSASVTVYLGAGVLCFALGGGLRIMLDQRSFLLLSAHRCADHADRAPPGCMAVPSIQQCNPSVR